MKRLIHLIAVFWTLGTLAAWADDRPVVVELYTSQGCSSCPPADAYLRQELAGRDDVIALALHVDYWDYIGWKDLFADPRYTKRQKGYAHAAGQRSVYTPQMIVGGKDHVVGNHPEKVEALIQKHKKMDRKVDLTLEKVGGKVRVSASSSSYRGPMVVQLVRYEPGKKVSIKRGENAGKVLSYANIVREWHQLAEWNGDRPFTIERAMDSAGPVVVIVQERGFGPILAAAALR
ncbi:DUF1223 domain-containing protein [Shimia biformata]|uniref:DUF1223 domain-containing protein n=1 Tax=Shimia biformata TaxID=1294299 RepID=UPI00195149AB|nr:DUF1223 domain-containing protein [Shimia biformata]